MTDLQYIEQQIFSQSLSDIKDNYEKDPLGCSLYLYFLLKNKRYDPIIDNLVDWMNTWIEKILLERNTTRFVDREITSSLIAYRALEEAGKLKKTVENKELDKFLKQFVVNGKFFSDFSFSTVILFAISFHKEELSFFQEVIKTITEEIKLTFTFNDSKNLVFCSLLFRALDDESSIKYVTSVCLDRMIKREFPPSDSVYYAWVLWNNKEYCNESEYPKIIDFIETTIQSMNIQLSDQVIDGSILEQYGRKPTQNVSRLAMSLMLDLVINFNQQRTGIPTFSRSYVTKELEKRGWTGTLQELTNAEKAFDEGRTNDCCRALRTAVIRHMVDVARLFDASLSYQKGKTPDPTIPRKILVDNNLPDDLSSFLPLLWSYLSERSHTEKSATNKVNEDEARLGFQLSYSIIELLLRFASSQSK